MFSIIAVYLLTVPLVPSLLLTCKGPTQKQTRLLYNIIIIVNWSWSYISCQIKSNDFLFHVNAAIWMCSSLRHCFINYKQCETWTLSIMLYALCFFFIWHAYSNNMRAIWSGKNTNRPLSRNNLTELYWNNWKSCIANTFGHFKLWYLHLVWKCLYPAIKL